MLLLCVACVCLFVVCKCLLVLCLCLLWLFVSVGVCLCVFCVCFVVFVLLLCFSGGVFNVFAVIGVYSCIVGLLLVCCFLCFYCCRCFLSAAVVPFADMVSALMFAACCGCVSFHVFLCFVLWSAVFHKRTCSVGCPIEESTNQSKKA